MGLGKWRQAMGMTQRELARLSGVNFRSLQDYEQGHKPLSSASGESLVRLAAALNTSPEVLVLSDRVDQVGAPLLAKNELTPEEINGQTFVSDAHRIPGRWICTDTHVATMFYYEGQLFLLPAEAIFSRKMLPFIKAMGRMQIDQAIDDFEFERRFGG